MKLVVDANTLFSAYLKGGLTRKLWFDRRLELYAPAMLALEFGKYAAELQKRSGLRQNESARLTTLLFGRINVVRDEEMTPYAGAARHLTTDEKDEAYIAAALAIGADLWTRDRDLRQPRIRVWRTEEIAEELGLV